MIVRLQSMKIRCISESRKSIPSKLGLKAMVAICLACDMWQIKDFSKEHESPP